MIFELDPRPVIQSGPLCSLPGAQGHPGILAQFGDHRERVRLDKSPVLHEAQCLIAAHRQHIRLPAFLQHAAEPCVRTIDGVGENEGTGNALIKQPCHHVARHFRLGGEGNLFGHMGLRASLRIIGP